MQHKASISISAPLKDQILAQYSLDRIDTQLVIAKQAAQKLNRDSAKEVVITLGDAITSSLQQAMDLAQEKGASSWLTSLPVEEFGFTLHKGAFRDAIALEYGWQPSYSPSSCACGSNFSVEHALSCPRDGFPTACHNEVRDLTANLMTEVCHDEPTLQPITGEVLSNATTICDDGARLDIAANGFWGGERAFFDVRVFNPYAPSNRQPLPTGPATESTKTKRKEFMNLMNKEFVKLNMVLSLPCMVMSLSGGLGNAASVCYKRLASLISVKCDVPYSSTMAWIRCSLSFSLLCSSIQCIGGARSSIGHAAKQPIPPLDLVSSEARFSSTG